MANEKQNLILINIKSNEHEEQAVFQETEIFKDMEIQGATTIFAVNLKRILKLLNEKE